MDDSCLPSTLGFRVYGAGVGFGKKCSTDKQKQVGGIMKVLLPVSVDYMAYCGISGKLDALLEALET